MMLREVLKKLIELLEWHEILYSHGHITLEKIKWTTVVVPMDQFS